MEYMYIALPHAVICSNTSSKLIGIYSHSLVQCAWSHITMPANEEDVSKILKQLQKILAGKKEVISYDSIVYQFQTN